MKHLLSILFFLTVSINLSGQNPERGIYTGKALPFTICYLTYSDSIIEVEYFYEKGRQIFGHSAPKKLVTATEKTKPIFTSKDDSIKVYPKSDYFLIKRERHEKIKIHQTNDTEVDIRVLRNRHKLFSFSQDLFKEYSGLPNFNDQQFWEQFNSYHLENHVMLPEEQFEEKLNEIAKKISRFTPIFND